MRQLSIIFLNLLIVFPMGLLAEESGQNKSATTDTKAALSTPSERVNPVPAVQTTKSTATQPVPAIKTKSTTATVPAIKNNKLANQKPVVKPLKPQTLKPRWPARSIFTNSRNTIAYPNKNYSIHANDKGFFSLQLTNEFAPLRHFEYDQFGLSLGYGGSLFYNSAFELNAKFGSIGPFFAARYEQDITRHYKWIPGIDASLSFGVTKLDNPRDWSKFLSIGLEGGLFVKTFITKSYALLARTGINYRIPVNTSNILGLEPNFYIGIGFKKHFN